MSRARRYRIVSIVLILMLSGFVALTACSNYAEGDRCESLNGNDDCLDGLQCTLKAQLVAPYNSADRCCPVDRTRATHPACAIPSSAVGGDSAPPPDTGPTIDATVGDATVDTNPPPQEAGPDADAADDGG